MPKHGDINEATGMVFWSHDSGGRERWMDPMRYMFRKNAASGVAKRRYWKNPEQSRAALRKWHAENQPKKAASFARWSQANPDRIDDRRLMATYGIGLADYAAMHDEQGGKCAICHTEKPAKKAKGLRRLVVDHCHATGAVRGLLCDRCNTGIGMFMDNPDFIRKAASYVEKHKCAKVEKSA